MATPREYRDEFIARVKLARAAAGFDPGQMADILRVKENTYRRYEGLMRPNQPPTIMPTHLIPLFCTVCHVSETWLLTGQGKGPTLRPKPGPKTQARKKTG